MPSAAQQSKILREVPGLGPTFNVPFGRPAAPPVNFSTDSLSITYRPDLDQLTARWQQAISQDELMAGYAALREAALHYGCRYWLIDARRRASRSHNGPEWVTTQFLPHMQQELGGRLCVAFLTLPHYLTELPATIAVPPPSAPVQFNRFLDEGAANAWLATQQAAPRP